MPVSTVSQLQFNAHLLNYDGVSSLSMTHSSDKSLPDNKTTASYETLVICSIQLMLCYMPTHIHLALHYVAHS